MQKCLLYLIKWWCKPTAEYSKTSYTTYWKCPSPLHKQQLCDIGESTFSNNPGIVCTTWNTPMIPAISSSAFFIGSHREYTATNVASVLHVHRSRWPAFQTSLLILSVGLWHWFFWCSKHFCIELNFYFHFICKFDSPPPHRTPCSEQYN